MSPDTAVIHRLARRRAAELRDQAFADAARWLKALLLHPFRPRRPAQESVCP